MKISVVMPVYNGEKYLKEAINSILNQTISDFEFIIINDCSNDNTEEIIKSYKDNRIRYIKNEKNLGVAQSLNRGLDMAQGEYIARMDADDISLPDRFEKQVAFMDHNLDVAVCGTGIEMFGDTNNIWLNPTDKDIAKVSILFASCMAHPSVFIRKSVVDRENLYYNTEFEGVEDYELWTRIISKYNVTNLKDVLLKYRVHNKQVTQNYSDNRIALEHIVKTNLLINVDIDIVDEELNAYCDYCANCLSENKQLFDLVSLFEKIVNRNEQMYLFDKKILVNYLKVIIINIFDKQNTITVSELVEKTKLVSKGDLVKYNLKRKISRMIKQIKRESHDKN